MQHTYSWGPRSASFWMAALIALGISFIGLRFLFMPQVAAPAFGIDLPAGSPLLYGLIKGIRDLFSGLVLTYLLWTRNLRVTLVVFSLACLIPMTDGLTIWLANGPKDVQHLCIHWGTAAYGLVTSALMLRSWHRQA
ncbi:hypothetical protein DCC81_07930 [Chitinophaga parva]|uniref:DUF4267 domain-containing protein n=1 Tax=Chitinophaga parva TaxID=2169414 RepID=A0A2T7BP24_9BACT|nr:DUF4267 domain-containing protein [Chitinophaga parva]PUZ29371.1 hypothetical protein DCC81_07930 [Chitinophaga parva]